MAKRDMIATAAKAKQIIPDGYDLYAFEISQLFKMVRENKADGLYEALTTAFDYGFALGTRAFAKGRVERL